MCIRDSYKRLLMFAIVNIAGQQFKVVENTKYYVPKLDADVESDITFDEVLLVSADDSTAIGTPFVAGKKVEAKVLQLSLIHISEPTRLGMISYAVFCLKKKKKTHIHYKYQVQLSH
eukprot:TRINITY_DN3160_c0_g1_i3.p2 TRINITY_DN3160_c0_g1~~TRINITY_DN3160_c0_g1_i3.p2  ORF type:complete len:117 (-),score=13.12 TRINITY_DN3160_c0_g1_i3:5-355(-)